MIVFDLETGPVDDEVLIPLCPEFVPPPQPGEFDPAAVKIGNLKDQAKIDAKIAEAREAHRAAVEGYEHTVTHARINHLADFRSRAALSPITGRVLAVGFKSGKGIRIEDGGGDEEELLNRVWAMYAKCREHSGGPRKMAGWNIHGFDLPFLIRRSWLHGIAIPRGVRDDSDRYWNPLFVDLMQRFAAGIWRESTSLDVAAKFFRVGAKPDGIGGGDFARLWLGTTEEREQAAAYLVNDLEMTAAIAERMGIVA